MFEKLLRKNLFSWSVRIESIRNKSDDKTKIRVKPEVPLACCGSGCSNCVWLQYADDLVKYYNDNFGKSDEGIKEAIKEIEKLDDVNLRSYLIMELWMRLKNR